MPHVYAYGIFYAIKFRNLKYHNKVWIPFISEAKFRITDFKTFAYNAKVRNDDCLAWFKKMSTAIK